MSLLETYGLTERFIAESAAYEGLSLARIIAQYKGLYRIVTREREYLADVSGKLRYETDGTAQYPAAGDFVMAEPAAGDRAVIRCILPRKSVFQRTAAGGGAHAQIVAANIDLVFICMSLNRNYNLNRLERYLAVAWDSGATPVVVLTKADLCGDTAPLLDEVARAAAFADILVTSAFDDDCAQKLAVYLKPGVTAAFLGSSGVGKSTLINRLLGGDVAATREIGRLDKGRHTTTGRALFPCPSGGVVIDTPGMRELGVLDTDVSASFADVEALAAGCRFGDCTHTGEPGCALAQAVADGALTQRRLDNYLRLRAESGYEGLTSREIEAKKQARMFKDVGGMKSVRKYIRDNDKRK